MSTVYIPQGSQDEHPGNLPTHQPIYALPETEPVVNNAYQWNWSDPNTGSFEDAFVNRRQTNRPEEIKNSMTPYGLLPHFKASQQSTLYRESLEPAEFKPAKTELTYTESYENPYIRQNNTHGNIDLSSGMGKRYAQQTSRNNGPEGAKDYYTLWNTPTEGNCVDTNNVEPCLRDWFGAKQAIKKFEGFHPRVRIFPRKERYISTNPTYPMRPEAGYRGGALDMAPNLGLYQAPDNEDVTLNSRAPLPTSHAGGSQQPKIGNVYAKPKNMVTTSVMGVGGMDLDGIGDAGADNRINNPESRGSLKTLTTISAGAMGYWPQRNADDQHVQRMPDFPGAPVRRQLPDIRRDIDPDLIAAYRANPYTPAITNMPYPENDCGMASSVQYTDDLPPYASVQV